MRPEAALRSVNLLHSAIWLLFVLCIAAIPVLGGLGHFGTAAGLVGVVMVEVLVLAFYGICCPLTGLAARYTDDRRDNFAIYLPLWLALHNKSVFGTLFVLGSPFTFTRWLTRS